MRFEEIIRNERTEGFIEGFAEVVADPSFEKECQMLTDRVLHKLMANYYTTSISRILEIRPDVMHKIAIITRLQPTDLIEHIDKYVAEVCAEGHEIGLVAVRRLSVQCHHHRQHER